MGRVRVAVRVRPLIERNESSVVTCRKPTAVELRCPSAGGVTQIKSFDFDVCSQETEDFFEACGAATLMDAALEGMKATLLAYGATGSGKTYTIVGEENEGLVERCSRYLFDKREGLRAMASFYEIFQENVYDLLETKKASLPVRHDTARDCFYVPGLVEFECRNVEDVAAIVTEGRRVRRRGAHKLNRDSSRSHALLSLRLVRDDGRCAGKASFVDLAGNERLGKSLNENAAETGSINRSLFALGKVISSLSVEDDDDHDSNRADQDSQRQQSTHVPYRDSTLTKLLMDSLGGDVMTLMIACVSPAKAHLEETLCTLQYAQRAKGIKVSPSVQLLAAPPSESTAVAAELAALRRENARLREENSRLRRRRGEGWSASGGEGAEEEEEEERYTWSSRGASGGGQGGRVQYLDEKVNRLAENFTVLQAKLDSNGTNATKAQTQEEWQASVSRAMQKQQQEHALLIQQQRQVDARRRGVETPPHLSSLARDGGRGGYSDDHLCPRPRYAESAEKVESPTSSQKRYWRPSPLSSKHDPHLCAVHRQSTGDVVRRHREFGI